jgi:hypothetical protein
LTDWAIQDRQSFIFVLYHFHVSANASSLHELQIFLASHEEWREEVVAEFKTLFLQTCLCWRRDACLSAWSVADARTATTHSSVQERWLHCKQPADLSVSVHIHRHATDLVGLQLTTLRPVWKIARDLYVLILHS